MQSRAVLGILAVLSLVVAGAAVAAVVFPPLSGGPPGVSEISNPDLDGEFGGVYRGTRPDPVGGVRVGGSAGGIPILLWNDADRSRTVTVRLVHEESGETVIDRRVALPPDGTYLVRIVQRDRYALTVGSDGSNETETIRVRNVDFGCGDHRTTVRVRANGTVESGTIEEQIACG